MSRKRKAPVRKIYPDPKYRSVVISKFINSIMYDGKRSTAEKILYDALDKIKQIKGITYKLKESGYIGTGLIAQDLQKVLPEAVYTTNDIKTKEEHLAINYGLVIGLLVEAIKELESK